MPRLKKLFIGQNIRDALARRGMTKEELGDILDIGDSTINAYLRGDTCPNLRGIVQIALALRVSTDYLLTGQESIAESEPIRENRDARPSFDFYTCPECGADLYYEQKYCEDCGRRIVWG